MFSVTPKTSNVTVDGNTISGMAMGNPGNVSTWLMVLNMVVSTIMDMMVLQYQTIQSVVFMELVVSLGSTTMNVVCYW